MSMYNMLFGVQPVADIAIQMLKIDPSSIRRFRDAYFDWNDEEKTKPIIVIVTRTGGGNRPDYENSNTALTKVTGYIRDEDDPYDYTYANFYYSVPEAEKEAVIKFLNKTGKPPSMQEKFEVALNVIRNS